MSATNYIGQPVSRVDGHAKVTGEARYAGEHNLPNLAHGFVVSSHITRGRIVRFDDAAALAVPGVLAVFSHQNVSGLPSLNLSYWDLLAAPGKHFRYLQTTEINHPDQPVALVVAETFELARYAASLVQIDYEDDGPTTDLRAHLEAARLPHGGTLVFEKPKSRGDFDQGIRQADAQVEASYYQASQHHNPLEPLATTVEFRGEGQLTIYDKTQSIFSVQKYITSVFDLKFKNVRVLAPYVGGAFGVALRPQYQTFLAVLAARRLRRNVRVVLTRAQMFTVGHRAAIQQTLRLGATSTGQLTAVSHAAIQETSQFEDYTQNVVPWSGMLYTCPHVQLDYRLVPLDIYTPGDMRAPGAASGVYALECALDELSYQLGIDPVQLRLTNYTETNPASGHPFSSKALRACYAQGAAQFGWNRRNPTPRSMRHGSLLTGLGMATGVWDSSFIPTRARAQLLPNGKLTVGVGTTDIGTGTYTILAQIAAETLGLPLENVTIELGDTDLTLAFAQGGSLTAASAGTAVQQVCQAIKKDLFKLAKKLPDSPFTRVSLAEVLFADGAIQSNYSPAIRLSYAEVMRRSGQPVIKELTTAVAPALQVLKYSLNTHAAVFAEVTVDEDLGIVQVKKVVSAIAAGRILNPKTARSQILGGIVWGISQALREASVLDHRLGRYVNNNFGEYHIPVNLDIEDLEVIFVEEEDWEVNPLGVKGLGEIGIVGVAAAVANAIYHATGKRIRDLPITLEKLL
ncbi:MAG: xanthine dehydrogenase family protein molybdopterin-binding subunit [Janthinobacterium lividum]